MTPSMRSRQGHRLLQVGIALFLFSAFEGFAIPFFAVPRLGLSVHTLSAFLAIILLVLGLVWPRLSLGSIASRIAFWSLLYCGFAIVAAYVLAGVWGAGNETIPLAAGDAHGTAIQEAVIKVVAYSSAPGLVSFALVLWGLRQGPGPSQHDWTESR
jgi:(hydroxyamino)benzene mutase